MTNEEAIKLLIIESTFVEDVDENKGAECVREAYRMAIEALTFGNERANKRRKRFRKRVHRKGIRADRSKFL